MREATNTRMKARTWLATTLLTLAVTGCGPHPDDEDLVESQSQAILRGSLVSGRHWAVSVKRGTTQHYCSGIVYAPRLVITSAHCVPERDTDNSGTITVAEGARSYKIENAPGGTRDVDLVTKHPRGTFGSDKGVEVVVMRLTKDIDMSQFPSSLYKNKRLNLYGGTSVNLTGHTLFSYGYSHDGVGGARALRFGTKRVSQGFAEGWYGGVAIDGQGTTCDGDSGGPDIFWNSNLRRHEYAGIHTHGNCQGIDSQVGVDSFRSWLTQNWP
jgi:hypothetical protein